MEVYSLLEVAKGFLENSALSFLRRILTIALSPLFKCQVRVYRIVNTPGFGYKVHGFVLVKLTI